MKTRNWLDRIALFLLIVGGLNWLAIGLLKADLVAYIFMGADSFVSRTIYTLVGISALYCISLLFRDSANND